ncbi:MAG: ComF family protein [Acetatifactor sp.]|nr:ComF family protein [Acetatifactor sp.]
MRKTIENGLRLFFPYRCPVCDEPVPIGQDICPECIRQVQFLLPPWCMKCGKKLQDEGVLCFDCQRLERKFVRGRSLYEYDSVVKSIYRMKYAGRREYAGYYGREMAKYLGEFIRQVNPDGIVPIPLHRSRERTRGYNQAELLAKSMGKCLGIPVYPDYLVRIKNTRPLKTQNPEERQNNLKKAFIIGRNDVKLKQIVLVDDIFTTGSTIDEATVTLLGSGVQKVYFVTLSSGSGD